MNSHTRASSSSEDSCAHTHGGDGGSEVDYEHKLSDVHASVNLWWQSDMPRYERLMSRL